MNRRVLGLCLTLGLATTPAGAAAPANAEALKANVVRCVQLKTSGEDRLMTTHWVFAAMSVSKELAPYTRSDPVLRRATNKKFADLFTRLATRDCKAEMLAYGGDLELAFGTLGEALGEIGFGELLKAPDVEESLGAYTEHLDTKAFAIFEQ